MGSMRYITVYLLMNDKYMQQSIESGVGTCAHIQYITFFPFFVMICRYRRYTINMCINGLCIILVHGCFLLCCFVPFRCWGGCSSV